MKKKYLFVGEYDASYTGGSVVFISTEEFLNEFEMDGFKIIRDSFNTQLRRIRNLVPHEESVNGIKLIKFWNLVRDGNFSSDFIHMVNGWLNKNPKNMNERYPGYSDGRIRVDWFPDNDEGIYIVYKMEVQSENDDEIEIISNTYYCA
jgi:hypothetical protein